MRAMGHTKNTIADAHTRAGLYSFLGVLSWCFIASVGTPNTHLQVGFLATMRRRAEALPDRATISRKCVISCRR